MQPTSVSQKRQVITRLLLVIGFLSVPGIVLVLIFLALPHEPWPFTIVGMGLVVSLFLIGVLLWSLLTLLGAVLFSSHVKGESTPDRSGYQIECTLPCFPDE